MLFLGSVRFKVSQQLDVELCLSNYFFKNLGLNEFGKKTLVQKLFEPLKGLKVGLTL